MYTENHRRFLKKIKTQQQQQQQQQQLDLRDYFDWKDLTTIFYFHIFVELFNNEWRVFEILKFGPLFGPVTPRGPMLICVSYTTHGPKFIIFLVTLCHCTPSRQIGSFEH